ncbi:MAG: hypothetical protein WCP55_10335, partial [Lentisphaerota bacterium]
LRPAGSTTFISPAWFSTISSISYSGTTGTLNKSPFVRTWSRRLACAAFVFHKYSAVNAKGRKMS